MGHHSIFERFSQVESGDAKQKGGTGLGLSMVHGMTEQMGGRFRLLSKVGEGTDAQIYLPVTAAAGPPVKTLSPKEAAPRRALVVLVVDDDEIVLLNTTAMLEDMGQDVIEARSGEEALTLLQEHKHVDLVITDQAMPNMTGIELLERILQQSPRTRVIVATGYAELPPSVSDTIPILRKPFMSEDLARCISRIAWD